MKPIESKCGSCIKFCLCPERSRGIACIYYEAISLANKNRVLSFSCKK